MMPFCPCYDTWCLYNMHLICIKADIVWNTDETGITHCESRDVGQRGRGDTVFEYDMGGQSA